MNIPEAIKGESIRFGDYQVSKHEGYAGMLALRDDYIELVILHPQSICFPLPPLPAIIPPSPFKLRLYTQVSKPHFPPELFLKPILHTLAVHYLCPDWTISATPPTGKIIMTSPFAGFYISCDKANTYIFKLMVIQPYYLLNTIPRAILVPFSTVQLGKFTFSATYKVLTISTKTWRRQVWIPKERQN